MGMTNSARRFSAWVACFAILLAALAPSVSHAVAAAKGSGSPWLEICTTVGTRYVRVAQDHNPVSPVPAQETLHFEHCPFCLTHAVSLGLPPADAFILPAGIGGHAFPFLFYQSPRPLFAWGAAQPRAPPAIS